MRIELGRIGVWSGQLRRGGRYMRDELEAEALGTNLLASEESKRRSGRVSLALDPAPDDD